MLYMPEAAKVVTRSSSSDCVPLKNQGSHSTIRVQIGTPKSGKDPQMFDLIADTGSSSIIVTNCICKKMACEGYSSPCFLGKNSKTFLVTTDSNGDALPIRMTFGSGGVDAVLSSDRVRVGRIDALMNNSLLMLYDHQLDAGITNFEGIFGIGIPEIWKKGGNGGLVLHSWLQRANVNRFSMCFTDMNKDGMLEMNTAAPSNAMGSVGKVHWGLEFRGISIGASTSPVIFCDPEKKAANQTTACGMIPDSGTTMIMGPPDQIAQLYGTLCDTWALCAQAWASQSHDIEDEQADDRADGVISRVLKRLGIKIPPLIPLTPEQRILQKKVNLFKKVLSACPADADAELPRVHLHVAGAEGNKQTLELPGSSYIVAAMTEDDTPICIPFFSSYSYETEKNGPIWIVGTPLFYDYKVHYDISTKPPSMSFAETNCGSCGDSSAQSAPVTFVRAKHRAIRKHNAPMRIPKYNTSLPF